VKEKSEKEISWDHMLAVDTFSRLLEEIEADGKTFKTFVDHEALAARIIDAMGPNVVRLIVRAKTKTKTDAEVEDEDRLERALEKSMAEREKAKAAKEGGST